MNPNLAGYYWAEQSNRERLSDQAARGWLAEEADRIRASRPAAANLRRVVAAQLMAFGARLPRIVAPRPARSLANQGGTAG